MKIKIFIVLLFGILFKCNICFSHSNDSIIKYLDSLEKADTFRMVVNDTLIELKSGVRTVKINTSDLNNCECLSGKQWTLVFTPFALLILFIILFIYLIIKTGPDIFFIKLKNSLLRSNNPKDPPGVISLNRLIAFLSASISCIVILMIISLYTYNLLANCKDPLDFSSLNTLLGTLGIGIAIPISLEKSNS